MEENEIAEVYLLLNKENQKKLLIFARSLEEAERNPLIVSCCQPTKPDE